MAETPHLGGSFNNNFACITKKHVNGTSNANITNVRRKTRQSQTLKRKIHSRVVLEKVLGVTSGSSGLACDPNTGLVAYYAGCVVVILNPKKHKQSHILNTSRKTFSSLAFSQDGKYLATGESGHMPCVRVWDVAERVQVAEVQCHQYGVACVAFSANGSYIVSVGYQHDQTVRVWEWRKGTVIAFNKVSSRVLSISFSEDNSYFVTAGNRHVKFWYLDASKERRVNSTVPLIGRSGLLGEQRNSKFSAVACGRGTTAASTYCITHNGLLCLFGSKRDLESWVDLKTTSAHALVVSEHYVFCGCADGMVRVFRPQNLQYITTLHQPHRLGVDVTEGIQPGDLFRSYPDAKYPDTLALTYDPVARHLTCVYNDHSVYVWDVHDLRNVGKVYSALYHSGCVWNVETYPEVALPFAGCLPPNSFFTCSSDNTIRLWHSEPQQPNTHDLRANPLANPYSRDLMRIVYVGEDTQHLQEGERGEGSGSCLDGKSGIRVLGVSPDGQHLAAGDRHGNIRIFDLHSLEESVKILAHDSEVLCLEFSPMETGLRLLASASRDRLIHVFNVEKNYNLEQTVYDHSASITAIKFSGESTDVNMISCGADKSIYFRTAEQTDEGLSFSRSHYVAEKATLYDMDLDSSGNQAAVACQDRNVRVYNIKSGKMMRCFKGSLSEEGTLLKVQMDPSGTYLATSCSDKNISIFDYESGECVANLFGHSEIVTGMRFSQDCRHLITVSGDSCVFVWRLDSQMTNSMRKHLQEQRMSSALRSLQTATRQQQQNIRRETYVTVPAAPESLLERGTEDQTTNSAEPHPQTPAREDSSQEVEDSMLLQTNGRLPMWARKLAVVNTTAAPSAVTSSSMSSPSLSSPVPGGYQPRGRWAEQADPQTICSLLDMCSLQVELTPSPQRPDGDQQEKEEEEEGELDPRFHPKSLDSLMDEEEEEEGMEDEAQEEEEEEAEEKSEREFIGAAFQRPNFLQEEEEDLFFPGRDLLDRSNFILYPANSTRLSSRAEGDFDVKALCEVGEELSPDSACCVGSTDSRGSNQEPAIDVDTDSLSQVSSAGSSGVEEEEEAEEEEPETLLRQHFDTLANGDHLASNAEKFDTDLRSLQPTSECNFLNPRLSISTRFLSRFQSRLRGGMLAGTAPRMGTLPITISEESTCSDSSPVPIHSTLQTAPKELQQNKVKAAESGPIKAEGKSQDVSAKTQSSAPLIENMAQNPSTGPTRKPAAPLPDQSDRDSSIRTSQPNYMGTTSSFRAKASGTEALQGENSSIAPGIEPSEPTCTPGFETPCIQDLDLEEDEFKENLPTALPPPSSRSIFSSKSTALGPQSGPPASPASLMKSDPAPLPGNHDARMALRLDLSGSDRRFSARALSPAARKPQRLGAHTGRAARLSLVTPTEMRSLGNDSRKRLSSVEDTVKPPNGPAPTTKPPNFTPPVRCNSPQCPPEAVDTMKEERNYVAGLAQGNALATTVASPARRATTSKSGPQDQDDGVDPMDLQDCVHAVTMLTESVDTALRLYNKLHSQVGPQEQHARILSMFEEAFSGLQTKLQTVLPSTCTVPPPPLRPPEESPERQLRDQRTVALLERYSDMLLNLTGKKMDSG